jgi:hypothetical protein
MPCACAVNFSALPSFEKGISYACDWDCRHWAGRVATIVGRLRWPLGLRPLTGFEGDWMSPMTDTTWPIMATDRPSIRTKLLLDLNVSLLDLNAHYSI